MAELKDFTKKSATSLSDFVSEVATNPMWSRPSAQNFAAHASLMSEAPMETYDKVMAEMSLSGTSATQNSYLTQLGQQSEQQLTRAMEGILLETPEDEVQPYVDGYVNMPAQTQHEALEREAILAPMANETVDSEEFRIDTGNRLRTINERRSIMQTMLNEELAKTDQGVISTALDLAEMFVPVVGARPTAQLMEELGQDGWDDYAESFILNGEARQTISEAIRDMPEAQRLAVAEKLIEAINNSPNVVLFNENNLEKANLLRTALEEGYYTDFDRWLDNAISVMDSTGVGAVVARVLGVGKGVKAGYNAIQHMARRDAVKSPVAPHSASQALKDTNPDKYRSLHEAMLSDASGEVSEAAYGTSRVNSIGHDIAGEVLQPFDVVKNKVDIPIRSSVIRAPNPRVMDVATANGTVYLTEAERAGVTARVINDFRNATGIQPRTAMTREGTVIDGVTGEFSNNTVKIRAVYGTVDGGFVRERSVRVIEEGPDPSIPTVTNKRGEEFFDTRGAGAQYHGSSTRLGNLSDTHYTSENIYGQGFYTSEAMDIVSGYSRKGRGADEVIYKVEEKAPVNFYDMDAPLDEGVTKIVRGAFGDDLPTEDLSGGSLDTLAKLFDEIRADSANYNMSKDDVQGVFDSVRHELSKLGYGGYSHRGGRLTGNTDHQVKIYWEPENQVNITEVNKGEFQPVRRTTQVEELGPSAVDDAIERTKIALRHYGVDDSDISILVRDGEHFNPVPSSLASRDLDNFMVQVDFPYRAVADDIPLEQFNVKWNVFDRVSAFTGNRQGSLQRHVLAPSSMLRREAVGGASVGVDRGSLLAKELLDLGSQFTDIYEKLPLPRQAAVFEEIKRANFEGKAPNRARLISEGFEQEELSALDKWKDYWDTTYHLENRDKRLTMASQGYQRVVNPNGTILDARPISKNQVGEQRRVYDVDTDSVVTLSRGELDDLYEKGGHFSSMKNEINIGGEVVGGDAGLPVMVRNQVGGTMSRGYRDWDNVLDYREGYFAVKYDAEYFIVKEMAKPDGTTYERAIAVSGDAASASKRAAQLAKEGGVYRVRGNVKGAEYDKFHDSIQLSGGRSSQRIRGERLEDATDVNSSGFDMQYVMNPVDSMVNTARGMSDRVAMREFMEVSKSRFLQQFSHLLPKNKFGQTLWPSRVEHIGRTGEISSKELADARTTWEAINYWENGYINAIDDGWKAALREMGQIAGMKGMSRAEKLAFWASETAGPTTAMRRTAFNLYLVLNPARQLIVQSHQAVQLAALRPGYVAKRLAGDFSAVSWARLGNGMDNIPKSLVAATGRSKEQLTDMYQAYTDSGLSASIDRQNLVRGSLLGAADDITYRSHTRGMLEQANRGLGKTLNMARRIGFDLGEEVNMMTSFLTFYDRALEANRGRKLSVEQLDDVTARARDFTYGMNYADDMPYNQNWLSMIFQFAQVPHKAAMQFTFNRSLTPLEKARVAAFNTVMYGVPPGSLLYAAIEPATANLPDEVREAAIFGLESYALNTALTAMAGEDVNLYYGGLQAVDSVTMVDLVNSLMTMNAMELLENSPSGSLLFGPNPRLTEWARTVMKATNFIEEDALEPTTLPLALKETFGLASGFSNAFKARLAYKTGEKTTAQGRVTKDGVNLLEAIGTAVGFETQEEMRNRYVSMEVYEKSKSFEDDVREQYRLTKMQMHRVGKDIRDADSALSTMQYGWLAFEGSTRAKEIWRGLMERDLQGGDHVIWNTLLRSESGGIMSSDEVRQFARTLPDGELKENYIKILDDMDKLKDEE